MTAQVGINTTSPQASLHVQENNTNTANTGVLIPRVNDLNVAPSINQDGMMVFLNVNWADSGSGKLYERGFWFWSNTISDWSKMESDKHEIGDIKNGFQTVDHKGWYLLDGRLSNTLSASAEANAVGIGFVTNLPDARDKVLKTTDGTDVIASSAGNNTYSLSQANLPAISLTGGTNAMGGHVHDYGGFSMNSNSSGYHNHYTSPRTVYTNIDGNHRHRHTIYLPGFITNGDGNHLHQVNMPTRSTSSTGNHSHTVSVSTGGSGAAIDNRQAHLVVNTFVYLGY